MSQDEKGFFEEYGRTYGVGFLLSLGFFFYFAGGAESPLVLVLMSLLLMWPMGLALFVVTAFCSAIYKWLNHDKDWNR
jgi:hypothetical protein